ncbi:hypothetical protein DM860_016029 [Cuscuta australis]|uniref:Uncharacterized protein n=1 Tax=Cuscuta australis TaxID=267555 RepID=A0A328DIT2_9ASTE|nr:hypothetical protein DM860_016029 [Cuscuta australis]
MQTCGRKKKVQRKIPERLMGYAEPRIHTRIWKRINFFFHFFGSSLKAGHSMVVMYLFLSLGVLISTSTDGDGSQVGSIPLQYVFGNSSGWGFSSFFCRYGLSSLVFGYHRLCTFRLVATPYPLAPGFTLHTNSSLKNVLYFDFTKFKKSVEK